MKYCHRLCANFPHIFETKPSFTHSKWRFLILSAEIFIQRMFFRHFAWDNTYHANFRTLFHILKFYTTFAAGT